jgi:hypothetical protein
VGQAWLYTGIIPAQETGVRGYPVWDQPGLHSETLFFKKKRKEKRRKEVLIYAT